MPTSQLVLHPQYSRYLTERALVLPPQRHWPVTNTSLPFRWLGHLDSLLGCSGKLLRHVRRHAAFGKMRQLIEGLKILYFFMSDKVTPPLTNDQKAAIKAKIDEGVENCSDGFLNRVNAILIGLKRPMNLEEVLTSVRLDIVTRAAYKTDCVHTHNTYFTIASQEFGWIHPVSEADTYRWGNPEVLRKELVMAMKQYYTPIAIVQKIVERYSSEIAYLGYHGPKPANSGQGYSNGEYSAFIDYFHVLLDSIHSTPYEKPEISEVLLMDEEGWVYDLNWPQIESHIARHLVFGAYIDFDQDAALRELFLAIFDESNDNLRLFNQNIARLSRSPEQIAYAIGHVARKSEEAALALIRNLIVTYSAALSPEEEALGHIRFMDKIKVYELVLEDTTIPMSFYQRLAELDNRALSYYFFKKNGDGVTKIEQLVDEANQRLLGLTLDIILPSLPDYERISFISDIGKRNSHFFMNVLEARPSSFFALFSMFNKVLAPDILLRQFTAEDANHYHAFYRAVERLEVRELEALFADANFLSSAHLKRLLLKKVDEVGKDCLLVSATRNKEVLTLVSHVLYKTQSPHHVCFVDHKDHYNQTLLMYALKAGQLEVANLLLRDARQLNRSVLNEFLFAANITGENAFIQVIKYAHEAVESLLRFLEGLDPVHLDGVLLSKTDDGYSFVEAYVQKGYDFKALQRLLARRPEDVQAYLLLPQKSLPQYDILYQALRVKSNTVLSDVLSLLETYGNGRYFDRYRSMGESIAFDFSLLNDALEYHPESFIRMYAFFEKMVAPLPLAWFKNPQALSLLLEKARGDNLIFLIKASMTISAPIYSVLFEAIGQAHERSVLDTPILQALYHLSALNDKAQALAPSWPAAAEEARLLYKQLTESLVKYLETYKAPEASSVLRASWQDSIEKAKQTCLMVHRGVKDLLMNLLMAVSVVGLLYVAAKRAIHYYQHGHFNFFRLTSTHSEEIIDQLKQDVDHMANAASHPRHQ